MVSVADGSRSRRGAHLGSAPDEEELAALKAAARQRPAEGGPGADEPADRVPQRRSATALTEVTRLSRTLKRRAGDLPSYFDRPGTAILTWLTCQR